MERSFVFHPASATNRVADGADAQKREGVNFAWWEQVFDKDNELRCFFQGTVIPDALIAVQNTVIRAIFRQVSAGAGDVVLQGGYRQHDPSAGEQRDSAVGWTLFSAPPQAVPGTQNNEFVVSFNVSAALLNSNKELLLYIERDGAAGADTFGGDIALVRIDVDFPQTDPGFWQAGIPAGSIFYGAGPVGVGTNNPQQSFHTTGGILIGNTGAGVAGSIRYTGSDIEGHVGGSWKPMTSGGAPDADWLIAGPNMSAIPVGQVAIGSAFGEKLNIAGAIRLDNVAPAGVANGTISYSTVGGGGILDFWARKGGAWVSMTQAGSPDGDWTVSGINLTSIPAGNVGIGVSPPLEKLDVSGAVRIGNTANNNVGTIKWDGVDFFGRTAGGWISLTAGASGGNTLGQAYNQGGAGVGRVISVAAGLPVLITGITPDGLQLDNNMMVEFGSPTVVGVIYYTPGNFVVGTQTNSTAPMTLATGAVSGGTSGNVEIRSGNSPNFSGQINLTSGTAASGTNRGNVKLDCNLVDVATVGGIYMREISGSAPFPTNAGVLYVADDAGDSELFYRDDGGAVVKLTEDGWPTDGIGTYSTTFDVNRGAVGGSVSVSDLTLRGSGGTGSVFASELKYTNYVGMVALEVNSRNLTTSSDLTTWLRIGSTTNVSSSIASALVFHAGTGAANISGIISFSYDSVYTTSPVFTISRHLTRDDDVRSYYGTEKNGWLYHASSTDRLYLGTKDKTSGSSSQVWITTGRPTGVGTSSGGIFLKTGDGINNGNTGPIWLIAGTPDGEGTRGDILLASKDLEILTYGNMTGAIFGNTSLLSSGYANFGGAPLSLLSGSTSARTPVYIGGSGDTSIAPNKLFIYRGSGNVLSGSEIVLQDSQGNSFVLWFATFGGTTTLRAEAGTTKSDEYGGIVVATL